MNFGRFAVRAHTDAAQEYWETVARYDDQDSAIRKAGELNREYPAGTAIHLVYDTSARKEIYRRGFFRI